MFRRGKRAWLAILTSGLLVGCGPELPKTVPVSGVIVYRNKPVSGAQVTFLREGERPGRGNTDDQGRFELSTYYSADYDALKGAVPGEYKVKVTKLEFLVKPEDKNFAQFLARTGGKIPKPVIPGRYGDPNTTDLTASVTEDGKNHFEFMLVD